jgi:hypothetical protein
LVTVQDFGRYQGGAEVGQPFINRLADQTVPVFTQIQFCRTW